MEDRLESILNRVIEWLKYEDAKNAALVTLDGVGAGLILQWLSNPSNTSHALSPWLKGALAALLLSIIVALFSFYPVLKGEKLHQLAAWCRKRRLAGRTGWKPNVLFFADIAGQRAAAYLKDLHAAISAPGDDTLLELDYAKEIIANAEIAVMKLRLFEAAFLVSFLAFIATCAGVVANLQGS